jgi:Mrp family chromosome partitioning ATPase
MVRQQEHRFLLDTPRADSIPSCRYETMKEGASMKIVVLLSQKGGTGKSTIATHLAVCAARDGKAVALFDIDRKPPRPNGATAAPSKARLSCVPEQRNSPTLCNRLGSKERMLS